MTYLYPVAPAAAALQPRAHGAGAVRGGGGRGRRHGVREPRRGGGRAAATAARHQLAGAGRVPRGRGALHQAPEPSRAPARRPPLPGRLLLLRVSVAAGREILLMLK